MLLALKRRRLRLLLLVIVLASCPVFAQNDADQSKRGVGVQAEVSKPTPQSTDKSASDRPELVIQTGHSLGVTAVAFSPDNKLLASGSVDNTVKLWDVAARQELRTLKGPIAIIGAVAFSPNGKWLAAGGVDGPIQVWDVVTGREWR